MLVLCVLLLRRTWCHSRFMDPGPSRAQCSLSLGDWQGSGMVIGRPFCSPLWLFFQGIVKLEHPRIHVDFPVIICEV